MLYRLVQGVLEAKRLYSVGGKEWLNVQIKVMHVLYLSWLIGPGPYGRFIAIGINRSDNKHIVKF